MPSAARSLQILRVLRHLLAAAQPYVSLLPVGPVAGKLSAPPFFSRIHRRAHRMHFHLENALHRCLDLCLRRLGRHLKTSVFWFSLMARPFSVITGRRMIWYADFIRPPPPLCHAVDAGDARCAPSSCRRFLWLSACVAVSMPKSSAKPAASRSPVAKKLRGHNAAGD